MQVTEVRIYPQKEKRVKAYASITLDNEFVVHNIRVVEFKDGARIFMPSRKTNEGRHRDIAHPIKNELRNQIEEKVINAYNEKTGEKLQLIKKK
ncbi:MAG: SpoVG family protein [Endomicrobia bacterium]|nr:SpoVG family protein [Endomicrobiia bacterium]MCX7941150.1 SpoVG family protein [Endomicrobiia bacterium]MDW8056300.1 SpoVG family protein [Elusimicrobiota bacterium]